MPNLVSIIIPNYNHAVFLPQRLNSVFNQTYQNFEVILLDDASTDDSVAVLEEYACHPKVSNFIVNETNTGSPFKQWKKGIDLAKGKYIWIAESDDYCEPNFLELLIPEFRDNIKLVYCASYDINEEGKVLGLNNWASRIGGKRWQEDYYSNGKKEIQNYLRYRNIIPNASAVVFDRLTLNNIKIPVCMKYCGDWYLWIKILHLGDVYYRAEPLNYFRIHLGTTRFRKEVSNELFRFSEYFYIVKKYSSIINRIQNFKKYKWIFIELERKKSIIEGHQKIKNIIPFEFKILNFITK